MGLLDEAIREHLELKRRRGGDPSVIAREEREALAPGLAGEPTDEPAYAVDKEPPDAEIASAGLTASTPTPAWGQDDAQDRAAELSVGGQETAELDMQAVMEDDPDAADPASPVAPIADELAVAGHGDDASEEDPLEWESPDERDRESPPQDIPGQERLTFE